MAPLSTAVAPTPAPRWLLRAPLSLPEGQPPDRRLFLLMSSLLSGLPVVGRGQHLGNRQMSVFSA